MNAIMLDIETLGVKPGCVVLSIGAVEFDTTTGELSKEFEIVINANDACAQGLTIEPSTVMWWMDQSESARDAVMQGTITLRAGLAQLVAAFDWNKRVWCNGASFDFPILEAAYCAAGLEQPWKFWNCMCFRTIKNLVPKRVYDTVKVEPAVAHRALDDAKAQALTLVALLKHLGVS